MVRVAIVGGSGYVGGELLRLLLFHPQVEVTQVTAGRNVGRFVHSVHPNLRGVTRLRFVAEEELAGADVLFLAKPHGHAARAIARYADLAERIIDCSADFRLDDGAAYERWYGEPHPAPEWLERFTYGLPEVNRGRLSESRYASGVGCNATALNLALLALVRADVVDVARGIVAELKVGSSEGGAGATEASHHPERSGVVRTFAPVGHRHTAEVELVLGLPDAIHMSVTSVELVRGALATAHVFLREPLTDRDVWGIYREAYGDEPFVRIVHDAQGLHRHPEPKLLAGTNFVDVGWAVDAERRRLVALAAIDNLVKGAAGSAVQSFNLMAGFDETAGLLFPGLHPS